ncbi:SDR family NAD(P)-dependent oxidoreductase [Spirosoma utsteinense]|uniref:NAD(P)-dependent dehydrogenase (Short-subunit alcohol dehydrogenase family) n=1 Tax=Spirosoma utsteinense TaxID=2585773 RepID=A0ABR6WF54_9BACT|nr:SDR family oxidoreductase [Spirosoma utsteinense]MBC3788673.1 NAD(P)-dependent dehydrogenase (short-subunit alcohol dehydrogenase family) [Spirosoma utsteinense]MBC3794635.1 NAD(P)-dependent dehydrogenase (short-subunit alcohol dehydrogenase family) [Spirosoma utsteinense]
MTTPKIALVTGGSRGLGKNMALNLAQEGIDVLLTYRSNETEARATVQEIERIGRKAAALRLDTAHTTGFDTFFEQVTHTLQVAFGTGRFDFLINNAGTGVNALIADTTEEQFDQMVNVHLKGVYFLTQKALPLLNDGGRIINISSGLTRYSFAGQSAYASMKSAVETFTRYLALEVGARGIAANVVAPGGVVTDFDGGVMRDPNVQAYAIGATALGRVGQPEDIGGVVAFLCSEKANWINGQRIEVTGGMNL